MRLARPDVLLGEDDVQHCWGPDSFIVGDAAVDLAEVLGQRGERQEAAEQQQRAYETALCTHAINAPSQTWGIPAAAARAGEKVWYEIVLTAVGDSPRVGWAMPGWGHGAGWGHVGHNGDSWCMDGQQGGAGHHGSARPWVWQDGDVVGAAADLSNGELG
eukprot:gene3704-9882_t